MKNLVLSVYCDLNSVKINYNYNVIFMTQKKKQEKKSKQTKCTIWHKIVFSDLTQNLKFWYLPYSLEQ